MNILPYKLQEIMKEWYKLIMKNLIKIETEDQYYKCVEQHNNLSLVYNGKILE